MHAHERGDRLGCSDPGDVAGESAFVFFIFFFTKSKWAYLDWADLAAETHALARGNQGRAPAPGARLAPLCGDIPWASWRQGPDALCAEALAADPMPCEASRRSAPKTVWGAVHGPIGFF
jgi:hypothetical protein